MQREEWEGGGARRKGQQVVLHGRSWPGLATVGVERNLPESPVRLPMSPHQNVGSRV